MTILSEWTPFPRRRHISSNELFAIAVRKRNLPKERITIRLDADIAAHFRATGKGWQTRLNAILRRAVAAEPNRSLE